MRIVYSILGTFNSGGMERVLANKANYLISLGYDVNIITTDQKGRLPYFNLDGRINCIDLGVNYTDNSNLSVFRKIVSHFSKQKLHRKRLETELFRLKADIVISMFDNDTSFLYKILDGSKKVLEIHFSRFKRVQYGRTGLLGIIDTYRSKQDLNYASKYDRFVVLTEEDKEYWGDLTNIEVIPNANSFTVDSSASLINKKVLAVGRLDYQKGFQDLIKAWKIVYQQNSDWILNIYGKGPLEDDLRRLVKELDLEAVVFLRDPVQDIQQIYLEHSTLAMTSRYEGLPMALLEAQVCGLPLVSYACKCGPRDIIEDGVNGFLVEENDVEGIGRSLLLLIESEDLRIKMGSQSFRKSKQYSEEIVMKKWLRLFSKLIIDNEQKNNSDISS